MRDIDIRRIMTESPATIGPEDTIERAQELLERGDLHHLPVVVEGRLVGLVSSADLLKFCLFHSSVKAAPVRSVMATAPVSIDVRASLRDAAVKLSQGGFHALPVVESDGSLVGIVTTSDLIEHLLQQLPTGDGSLKLPALGESLAALDSSEADDASVTRAVAMAEELLEQGEDNVLARAIVSLKNRNHRMRDVCQAAEHYVRSGRAEHEHSILIKKLAELRDMTEPVYL